MTDTRVAAARTARDESMQAASDAADVRLVLTVDKVIAEAIASGQPFSSNTIRDRMPTVRPGLIGSRIKAASMRRPVEMVKVGEEPSTLRSTHAKSVCQWIGVQA